MKYVRILKRKFKRAPMFEVIKFLRGLLLEWPLHHFGIPHVAI